MNGMKDSSSIWANMIPIPFDMCPTCKAKAAIRKLAKFENEKLMFKLRLRIFFSQFHPENVMLADASYLQTELLLFIQIIDFFRIWL